MQEPEKIKIPKRDFHKVWEMVLRRVAGSGWHITEVPMNRSSHGKFTILELNNKEFPVFIEDLRKYVPPIYVLETKAQRYIILVRVPALNDIFKIYRVNTDLLVIVAKGWRKIAGKMIITYCDYIQKVVDKKKNGIVFSEREDRFCNQPSVPVHINLFNFVPFLDELLNATLDVEFEILEYNNNSVNFRISNSVKLFKLHINMDVCGKILVDLSWDDCCITVSPTPVLLRLVLNDVLELVK